MSLGIFDLQENQVVLQEVDGVYRVRGRLKDFFDTITKTGELPYRTGEADDELATEEWGVIKLTDPEALDLLVDTLGDLDFAFCEIDKDFEEELGGASSGNWDYKIGEGRTMKVKVGNKVYDGKKEPVMVILSQGEKEQIANMQAEATKYCVYPSIEGWIKDDYARIKAWMNEEVKLQELHITG